MSDDVLNVQNKILSFSVEEQLYLLAYIANNLNNHKNDNVQKKSCFGALKNEISYIAPDFDEPIEDFAEYM